MLNIQTLTSDVQHLQNAVDLWNNIGLYFLFCTALIAAGYFVVSRIAINKATKLRIAQVALGNAQEGQLKRELKDKDLEIAYLQKAVRPRTLDHKIFLEELKGKPKAKVEILYKPHDDEAWSLAFQIRGGLSGIGWEVVEPRPLTEADIPRGPFNKPTVPLSSRYFFKPNPGLGLIVNWLPNDFLGDEGKNNSALALNGALINAGVGGGIITVDPNLPDGLIKIIVGQKN